MQDHLLPQCIHLVVTNCQHVVTLIFTPTISEELVTYQLALRNELLQENNTEIPVSEAGLGNVVCGTPRTTDKKQCKCPASC